MFGEKCTRCGKRIKKAFEFCPNCGVNLGSNNKDYGFLGKEDIDEFKLPFGFKMILKPLIKELNKQMSDVDKEMKNQQRSSPENSRKASFSIRIGVPGQKPVNIAQVSKPVKKHLIIPKISESNFKKLKELIKKEPKTEVRRLSDRVVYEISLPKVKSIENINIDKLESGFEIKAFSDTELFVKSIEVNLPLINYGFEKEKLILELGLK